jgi:CBS domain-containing protein
VQKLNQRKLLYKYPAVIDPSSGIRCVRSRRELSSVRGGPITTEVKIMQCKEIMEKDVQFVFADEKVDSAAEMMRDSEIGFVPVCDPENKKVVGTLTDRDIAIRIVAESRAAETPVSEVMTTAPIFCNSDDDVGQARELMESHQVSRVIVLDNSERLAGVISLADIAEDEAPENPA